METKPSEDAVLLHAVFDATVDAIMVSDSAGQIIRVNPAAARMFGYSQAELLGLNVSVLMPEDVAERHGDFMQHHIDTGEANIIGIGRQLQGLRKDGETFPLHLSVGRVELPDSLLFVGILHDLTRRAATEAALARSQRLDALGQMTGGIAHDFNNLLTVIVGNLELLAMQNGDPESPLLHDALEAAELGADLTSRLMMFARKGMLEPEAVDINEACRSALAMLRRAMGPNHEVVVRFSEELPEVFVDKAQLQTALLNLALNARDAMPHGGQFMIRTESVEIDDNYVAQETDVAFGQYVRLTVSDNGEGMSATTQARVFEPFFTTKAAGKGTGLGLAMVHGFMRQSGGHVTLYSEEGHGTSFSMYFPVRAFMRVRGDDVEAYDIDEINGRGESILVVEDDDMVRNLSVSRITALGYKATAVDSGDAAYMAMCGGAKVDLVFSDLVMPGEMNGLDLARRMMTEFPTIPVVLTSGYSDEVFVDGLSGRTDFPILRKPYRQEDLARMLRLALAGRPNLQETSQVSE